MEENKDPKDLKIAELNSVIAMLMDYKVNFMGKVCEIRDVKEPCRNCGGLGIQLYNDASTWRHLPDMKPQATKDVCEHCWGSGDSENIWPKRELMLMNTSKNCADTISFFNQFPCEAGNTQFHSEAGGNQFPCEASGITDAEIVKEATNEQEDGSIRL